MLYSKIFNSGSAIECINLRAFTKIFENNCGTNESIKTLVKINSWSFRVKSIEKPQTNRIKDRWPSEFEKNSARCICWLLYTAFNTNIFYLPDEKQLSNFAGYISTLERSYRIGKFASLFTRAIGLNRLKHSVCSHTHTQLMCKDSFRW